MNKPRVLDTVFTNELFKQWLILISASLLTTALVLYSTWVWVVEPANQRHFRAQVISNTQQYSAEVSEFLKQYQQSLEAFSATLPLSLLQQHTAPVEPSAPTSQPLAPKMDVLQHWAKWKQSANLALLASVNHVALLSMAEINQRLQRSPEQLLAQQGSQNPAVSFLLIDMVNRLRTQQSVFIEAAKIAGTPGWQLHKVLPIYHQQGQLAGVLYVTSSLEGINAVFNNADPLLAQIVLQQSVEGESPLRFFAMGTGSEELLHYAQNIIGSHWTIRYQPSTYLLQKSQQVPIWFIALAIAIFTMLVLVGLWIIYQPILEQKKAAQKAQMRRQEKQAQHSAAAQDTALAIPPVDDEPEPEEEPQELLIPDSIFRAYDIRGIAYEQFSVNLSYAIGAAFATEVLDAGDASVIVARDARTHSPEFASCLIQGIISTGCHVIDIGLMPTPMMNFAAAQHDDTSSGIIITASHNPKQYNGCKMVIKGNTLVDSDIQELKNRLVNNNVFVAKQKGDITEEDFSQAYIDKVINDVAVIDGWKVVVDAGNGASSDLAPRLFNALACKVHPLFCEFDGEFPNHDPDPSVPENLSALVDSVKDKQADIGFAFDGDGDRLMVVTAKGQILWPDQLLMLFAQDVVTRNPGCDVVFDIKSTQVLQQTITQYGGRPVMWKTGHSHIKAKMRETHALLGGEYSGHIFFKERWFGFDDGLYAAARLLEIITLTGQNLDELLAELPQMVSTPEIKIPVKEENKFTLVEQLIEQADFGRGQITTIDGLRVDFEQGWGLVRASNTAPVLTLRFEATNSDELDKIKQQFIQALHNIDPELATTF